MGSLLGAGEAVVGDVSVTALPRFGVGVLANGAAAAEATGAGEARPLAAGRGACNLEPV